jgi:phenylpropionate dioxygenase-like ring-hydroxylating dioxygenase large terminal subunit
MSPYASRPLRVTEEPMLRRLWYPIAVADDVAGAPLARRLLGVDLVLWRPEAGAPIRAAHDRCPHRDAKLSGGWLEGCALICPYHGWEYGTAGRATRIPQLDEDAAIPPRAQLQMVGVDERHGWAWVCLEPDDALLPIPEVPEYGADGWRIVREPDSVWDCPAPMLVENNLDPAHIAFVHRASFGSPAVPQVPVPDIVRTPSGFTASTVVPVQKRPGEDQPTERSTINELYGPAFLMIRITYPDGVGHIMLKAATPMDDERTLQLQTVLRTDSEAERPAADIIGFDDQVWDEDKVVLEPAHHHFSLDLTDNVHLKIDRGSLEYRRFLVELLDGGVPRRLEVAAEGEPVAVPDSDSTSRTWH